VGEEEAGDLKPVFSSTSIFFVVQMRGRIVSSRSALDLQRWLVLWWRPRVRGYVNVNVNVLVLVLVLVVSCQLSISCQLVAS